MATGKFTFTFNERELSIIEYALDNAVRHGVDGGPFTTHDFIEAADGIAERLAY